MRHLPALIAIAAAITFAAPGARAADQVRAVAPFSSVSTDGPMNIAVEVGKAQSVTASGSDRFLALLATDVVGGELRLHIRDSSTSLHAFDGARVVVTVPRLESFSMSGAGNSTISHLQGDRFDLDFSGAGSLHADGEVKHLSIQVSGVGNIDTKALHADDVHAAVSGVGSVTLYAGTLLDAEVSGVGSLTYYGNPTTVHRTAGGIGSISHHP